MTNGPCRLALGLVALAVGCGPKDINAGRQMGTLKGKLTLGGRPLPKGTAVTFQHAETGQIYFATTDPAGAFEVLMPQKSMPAGRYDVAVQPSATEDLSPEGVKAALDGPPGGAANAAKPVFDVPQKYRNPHESGLIMDVNPGPNEGAIDLK